jgi:alcohol dehydrogenase
MAAKMAGASEIICIDTNPNKFALAMELGCTRTINALDSDIVREVKDITNGGVDYAFEISGAKPATTTANAITFKGGEVICVGLGASNDMYQYAHAALVSEEKVIRGSFMGSCNVERDVPICIRMYKEGRLPVEKLKSRSMGFDDLNSALDRLDRGEVVRQMLMPNAA